MKNWNESQKRFAAEIESNFPEGSSNIYIKVPAEELAAVTAAISSLVPDETMIAPEMLAHGHLAICFGEAEINTWFLNALNSAPRTAELVAVVANWEAK